MRRDDYLRLGRAIIADAGVHPPHLRRSTTRRGVLATARACGLALVSPEFREPRHRWHYRAWLWAADALERHGLPPTDSETWVERCRIAERLDKDLRAGRPIVHAALLWTVRQWGDATEAWVCEHKPDLAAELRSTLWLCRQAIAEQRETAQRMDDLRSDLQDIGRQLDDVERDAADDWWRADEEGSDA